jgi:hypothetical protein
LAGARGFGTARVDHFVTCREHGDDRASVHVQGGGTDRRQEADLGDADALACREDLFVGSWRVEVL